MHLKIASAKIKLFIYFAAYYGHRYYGKRAADADAEAHGYAYECEKETKTICKKKPVTEEVSKDFELCRPKPNEVGIMYNKIYKWKQKANIF